MTRDQKETLSIVMGIITMLSITVGIAFYRARTTTPEERGIHTCTVVDSVCAGNSPTCRVRCDDGTLGRSLGLVLPGETVNITIDRR